MYMNYDLYTSFIEDYLGEAPHAENKPELQLSQRFRGVKYLDISQIQQAVDVVWKSGRLPYWLHELHHLEILRAPAMGLIVVDPWVSELKQLRILDLSNNLITTWPDHLADLLKLQVLRLDGNPCLEKQFLKSSSFQKAFLGSTPLLAKDESWATTVFDKGVATRFKRTSDVPSLNSMNGGIYTLRHPPIKRASDLITGLDPSPLQQRLDLLENGEKPIPQARDGSKSTTSLPLELWSTENHAVDAERTRLLLGFFEDIRALKEPERSKPDFSPVTMSCKAVTTCYSVTRQELIEKVSAFIAEEGRYISHLADVLHMFFSPRIKTAFSKKLDVIFDGFPELYVLHSRILLPILTSLVKNLSTDRDIKLEHFSDEMLNMLQSGEFFVYEEYGAASMTSFLMLYQCTRPGLSDEELKFAHWLEKKTKDPQHAVSDICRYLHMPFNRIAQYHEFLSSLVYIFPRLEAVATRFKEVRTMASEQIFLAKRMRRAKGLANHFGLRPPWDDLFNQYNWDAVLEIGRRTYLEEGNLAIGTNDVIVTNEKDRQTPMSAIREQFEPGARQLRVICNDSGLQIWDEIARKYVGTIEKQNLAVKNCDRNHVRLTFTELQETCYAEVKMFLSVMNCGTQGAAEQFTRACDAFDGALYEITTTSDVMDNTMFSNLLRAQDEGSKPLLDYLRFGKSPAIDMDI